jgi:hypothetical protein
MEGKKNPQMGQSLTLLLLAILVILPQSSQQVYCTSTNYCMACNLTTRNSCDACFNWGAGEIKARALNAASTPPNCQTTLTLRTDNCKFYKGTTITTATTRTVDNCVLCQNDVLHWTQYDNTPKCVKEVPGCDKVKNCLTTVCFNSTTGNSTTGCRMCKKGYVGLTWDSVNGAGSSVCKKVTMIANCDFHLQQSSSVQLCYSCASNYSVSSDALTCISFTTISDCRTLQAGNVDCHYCWHSYFWDGELCKLTGNLIRVYKMIGLLGIALGVFLLG